MGIPLGVLVVVYHFWGKRLVSIVLSGLMGLPPVVVGLVLYVLLSRSGVLGVWDILYTRESMVIAQVLLVTPLVAALTVRSMEGIWQRYGDMVILLGRDRWLSGMGLLWDYKGVVWTIVMAGFGRAMAEVGAIMIVGGNIEGYTRMMTGTIVLETNKGNVDDALFLGVVLLLLSLCVNGLMWFWFDMSGRTKEGKDVSGRFTWY
jgi:tungstate transport system permease protein